MLVKNGVLLKIHVVIYAVIHVVIEDIMFSFQKFSKTLNQFFLLIECKRKFGNLYTVLILAIARIKAILRYFCFMIFKQMEIISKIQNIMIAENYYIKPCNFHISVIYNETATQNVQF